MFDSILRNAIIINSEAKTVEFYKDLRGQKQAGAAESEEPIIVRETELFKAQAFGDEFYEVLKNMVKLHFGGTNAKVALILPDSLFFTDLFKVPIVNGKTESFVEVTVGTVYKNSAELKVSVFPLTQTKQVATYGVFGIKKDILKKVCAAIEGGGVSVVETTAYSCAMAAGAAALNNKLRGGAYMLVNAKESATEFIYAIGGKTVGFFAMPFGTKNYKKDGLNQEYALFDRKAAESVVLKAEEKAKKKRVSDTGEGESLSQQKRRKVPKFAMGEKPQSEEDFMYENFRVTIKYALEIIRANPELTAVEYPKAIYINLSDEYGFIFDRLKSEKNAFPFEPLVLNEALQDGISLAVYGGFYLKKYNKANNL